MILVRLKQTLDLKLTEMLWHDFKQAFQALKHSSVAEIKPLCKEWTITPPQRCESLIISYHKHSIAVLVPEIGITSY